MKKLLVLPLLFLISCADTETSLQDICSEPTTACYQAVPESDSTIPVDTSQDDNSNKATTKAITYIDSSYVQGSALYDSYGYLLPGGSNHANDALMWNSVSLATMCMLNGKDGLDFNTEITALWTTIKTNNFVADGRMIRHPLNDDTRTFSNDMMIGFLYLGAIAKKTECSTVTADYLSYLELGVDYLKNNNWDMQDPADLANSDSTATVMSNGSRRRIIQVLNIYGGDSSGIDPGTEGTLAQSKAAPWLNSNKYACRNGYLGSCVRGLNAGIYGLHLTFLSGVISQIEIDLTQSPMYSQATADEILSNLAKVGNDIGYPNWLFVAGYRHFSDGTFNDVNTALQTMFPSTLPSEANPTTWGCTDFIWQRVPYEQCNGSTTKEIGTDYLTLYAWTKL